MDDSLFKKKSEWKKPSAPEKAPWWIVFVGGATFGAFVEFFLQVFTPLGGH